MLEQNWKKVYIRTTTKSIPLIQPEYGFCQQKGQKNGRVHELHPNENVVVLLVCLNGSCYSSGCVGIVSKSCCQCNFSEIFKRRYIILEPCRNSKYPIWCLLWWHKTLSATIWTQAHSEPLQASKMECLCEMSWKHTVVNWLHKNTPS